MQVKNSRRRRKEAGKKTIAGKDEEKETRIWKKKSMPRYVKPPERKMQRHWESTEPSSRGLAWKQMLIEVSEKLEMENRLAKK